MDGKSLAVTDVGDVGDEGEVVDEGLPGIGSALHFEDDHWAALALDVLLLLLELRVGLKAGEADVGDCVVSLEVLGDGEGILAVPLHAEGEGLNPEEEHPGVVGGDAGSEVAEGDRAHAEDEGQGEEGGGKVDSPAEATVGCVGVGVERVVAAGSPGKGSGVDDDSSEAVSVSSHPLGETVDDNVGPVSDGIGEEGGGEGGIDNEGDLLRRRDVGRVYRGRGCRGVCDSELGSAIIAGLLPSHSSVLYYPLTLTSLASLAMASRSQTSRAGLETDSQ